MSDVPSFGFEMRKKNFDLRDDVTYVNHASYGVVPITVKQAHQCIRNEAETFSDIWIRKNRRIRQDEARRCISEFLNADPNDVVFIENVTAGMNSILKSFRTQRDDIILYTDQAYRSMQNACQARGEWIHNEGLDVDVRCLNLVFPIKCEDEVVDLFRHFFQTHKNVRMAVIEHVSCPSAIRMPIEKLIPLCREFGVLSVIDGAHGPGQFVLNIRELEPDFYLGNLYKWLYCPWNCAIMFVQRKHQHWIRPLVTSLVYRKSFQDDFGDQGVRDYSAYCTVPAAIKFYNDIGGHERISSYIKNLLDNATEMMTSSWGTETLQIPKSMEAPNIRMVRLPVSVVCGREIKTLDNSDQALTEITEKYKIATAVTVCNGSVYIRLSANIYNTLDDFKILNKFVNEMIILDESI